MDFRKVLVCLCWAVFTLVATGLPAAAQETNNEPIYLDEPAPEPEPRVAARTVLKDTYPDEKTPRVERGIVKLSNDKIVNDGTYIEYYPSGEKYTEGTYKMGVFHGDWSYWFPNGQLCKTVGFKDGRPDGQWDVFNQEGVRTSSKSYKDGKRDGKWVVFFDGGEQPKFEISYAAGLPVDKRITYFESGQKRQEIPFKDGKFHGLMTEWDESGKKIAELEFADGQRNGDIRRFE